MVTQAYKILVDWDNNGNFTGTHDDITSDVLSVQFRRGRDFASTMEGNSTAGVLKVRLNNESGKYSPSNTSSALTGNIKPSKPVKFTTNSALFPATFPITFDENPMFTGRLESLSPQPISQTLDEAELVAVGPLGYINQFVPKGSINTNIYTSQAVNAILDAVGWSATERDIDTGNTVIPKYWFDSRRTIDALRLVEETEGGFIKETFDGKIAFENRLARTNKTSQGTFSDASGASISYLTIQQEDPLQSIVNTIRASVRFYSTQTIATVWTSAENGTNANSIALVPSETKEVYARYPNGTTQSGGVAIESWTTPVVNTDFTADTTISGTSGNMNSYLTVSAPTADKQANRMKIILTNTHPTATLYVSKLQARGTVLLQTDYIDVESVDTDSVTAYGERSYTASTPFFPNVFEAQRWANYHKQVFSSPINYLTMTFSANANDASMEQALNREVSDKITITATSNANLGINSDFFIEEIKHHVSRGGTRHMVTFVLSPAIGGYSQFWELGIGKLGESTVPAY